MLENFVVDYWFWFGVAIILFIIEIFTFTSFSLWIGIGALLTGVIAFIFPSLDLAMQGFIFAIMAIVGVGIGYKYFRSQEIQKKKINSTLNRIGHQYIGQVFKVVEPIENGKGIVKVYDSIWIARCDVDLPVDTRVKVHNVEGNSLIVKPLENS